MNNPFRVRWLEGWTFQTVLIGGRAMIEAHGFGVCLSGAIEQGESPVDAADRLVLVEDRLRRSLHNAWKRGPQHLIQTVLDTDSCEELRFLEEQINHSGRPSLSLSPRQEVMQGLGR